MTIRLYISSYVFFSRILSWFSLYVCYFLFPVPHSILFSLLSSDPWTRGNLSEAEYSEFLGRQQCTLLAPTERVMLGLPWPPFWTLTCALLGVLGFAVCQSSAAINTGIFPQQKHSEMPLHTFLFHSICCICHTGEWPRKSHSCFTYPSNWVDYFIHWNHDITLGISVGFITSVKKETQIFKIKN